VQFYSPLVAIFPCLQIQSSVDLANAHSTVSNADDVHFSFDVGFDEKFLELPVNLSVSVSEELESAISLLATCI
jgi:hypothetical protein